MIRGDDVDPSTIWEELKFEIQQFSRKFATQRASRRRQHLIELEARLESRHKKLAMINLKSTNAVRLIQKVNQQIDVIQTEINKISRYNTQGAILRSRVKWYNEGEHNTKYFLSLEKSRAKNRQMLATKTSLGQVTRNPKEILEEQNTFYRKLYTSDPEVKFKYKNISDPKLSGSEVNELAKQITIEEIAQAIKEMPQNKTPGLTAYQRTSTKCSMLR